MFIKLRPGACIIKIITVVIYSFRTKLECLSLNTRLDWKGLPGTSNLANTETVNYSSNKFYDTGPWGQFNKQIMSVTYDHTK
jgi:hypothetical protein